MQSEVPRCKAITTSRSSCLLQAAGLLSQFTRAFYFDYRMSFTGSDLRTGDTLSTSWHELGHQLARETGLVPKDSTEEDRWGKDMEECVQKRTAELGKQQ